MNSNKSLWSPPPLSEGETETRFIIRRPGNVVPGKLVLNKIIHGCIAKLVPLNQGHYQVSEVKSI